MAESDAKLIERTKSGEKGAYFELVRRHEGPVVVLCFSLTKNRQEAHDLCQETFLRAFRALRGLAGSRSIGDWFLEQVRAVHKEWTQKNKKVTFEKLSESQEDDLPEERAKAFEAVADALVDLSDAERRAVVFWDHGEYWNEGESTMEGLAEFLGESKANAQSILARGQKKLRERLELTLDLAEFDK